MLIAIAIAEEIQVCIGARIQRSTSWPPPWRLHAQKNLISNLSENTTEIYSSSNQYDSNFLSKSKKTQRLKTWILGSLLQWRWQWASIGHFVFLFFPENFTPWDAHCFWQCTDSRTFTEGNFSTTKKGELFIKRGTFHINKNTKCPIDAHCHRHCRRDPRI